MNEAQRRMQDITDEYNIDGAVSVFEKTAGRIQEQADKLSAMDQIAVSEGEELDRQLDAISQKTEVDAALDALKAKLAGTAAAPAVPAKDKDKEKVSSAFDQ
jgi:phage shock protein A